MSSSAVTYTANERVLCYHGPLVYEAKVLKVDDGSHAPQTEGPTVEGPLYFVHYKGWKQSWDEWVPPARLLKFEEKNIQLQKSLQQKNGFISVRDTSASTKAKAQPKTDTVRTRKDGARGTKRGRDDDDGMSRKPEMKLTIPEGLKVMLVDDWEAVTKNNQLVPLPRDPTVTEILQQFREHVLANPKHLRDPPLLLPTIIAGLTVYFDKSLGANLLYRLERAQYAEQRRLYVTGQHVKEALEMSAIYGAEHLMRMIVSLPAMVASSTMDPESTGLVRDYVNELMVWMLENRERLFVKEYDTASQQYQSISRS